MLNHIVMFRRKQGVAPDGVLEAELVQRMTVLGSQIGSIRAWSVQANRSRRPVSWDYVLESSVDGEAALHAYLNHPLHVALVADLRRYFDLAVVDYAKPMPTQ